MSTGTHDERPALVRGLETMARLPRRVGRWVGEVIAGATRASVSDDITGVASQFAYNAFLATVPFLFVLVSLIGLVAQPDTFDSFLAPDAENAIPPELREVLRTALAQATANTGEAATFLVLGLLGALYVSANVMGALVGGLDRARGVPHRSWVRGKAVAAALALCTSVLVVVTTLALVGGSRLVEAIARELFGRGAPNVTSDLLYLSGAGSLLIFTLATFHVGPNAPRRRLIADVPGALISVVLWLGAMRLFAMYLENFDAYRTVYGALAGAAIYLVFLFVTCVALLIGAEVNEQMARMRARTRRRLAAERAEQEAAGHRAGDPAAAEGAGTLVMLPPRPSAGPGDTAVPPTVPGDDERTRTGGDRPG
ncbi:MAG: YihY/virulence factor BrkB family protein [Miltoncostaeaceae bacterium]